MARTSQNKRMTLKEMVAEAHVSVALLKRAFFVRRNGIAEFDDLIMSGRVTVNEAERVARLPHPEQREIVARFVAGETKRLGDGIDEALRGEERMRRLVRAWNACSDEQRQEFIEHVMGTSE